MWKLVLAPVLCMGVLLQDSQPVVADDMTAEARASAGSTAGRPEDDISSWVETTTSGDLLLVEEVWIEASLEAVWNAYTTSAGWEGWAAPTADVDLRVGGLIRTNYSPGASLEDEDTNTLHILNYAPQALLTLRAELQKNWPEIMQEDAERLTNTILFESMGPQLTRLRSYGMGYRDTPDYKRLMGFFISANAGLYKVLKAHLE